MQYTDLQDRTSGMGQPVLLDLDGDGQRDLGFSTIVVGDPQLPGDKLQFYATGSFNTYFPINDNEETPLLAPGAPIHIAAFSGYNWYNAPSVMLVQRVEMVNGFVYWLGNWNLMHRILPFYILRDNSRYFGWIELSFDTATQKTILHRSAVSLEAEKGVKAGVK